MRALSGGRLRKLLCSYPWIQRRRLQVREGRQQGSPECRAKRRCHHQVLEVRLLHSHEPRPGSIHGLLVRLKGGQRDHPGDCEPGHKLEKLSAVARLSRKTRGQMPETQILCWDLFWRQQLIRLKTQDDVWLRDRRHYEFHDQMIPVPILHVC